MPFLRPPYPNAAGVLLEGQHCLALWTPMLTSSGLATSFVMSKVATTLQVRVARFALGGWLAGRRCKELLLDLEYSKGE